MGNLVGEKFEDYVLHQIAARQSLYGSSYLEGSPPRSNNQLQLLNNKNAWLKMASSVSVIGLTEEDAAKIKINNTFAGGKYSQFKPSTSTGEKRLNDIGIDDTSNFIGTKLAQKTVLFNTMSQINPYTPRSGVSDSNTLWNNSSYGLGGTNQGLVPAPGLISFKMDSLNRGSIKKGTIELKCYNKFQFELIELVYLRLGFTMMIEWGWDKYTVNGEDIITTGNTIIEDQWFKGSGDTHSTQLDMLRKIEKYRDINHGNYDGFYCKVSNFSWKFNPDGTYDISIDLISLGDVVESIKVGAITTPLTLTQIESDVDNTAKLGKIKDSTIVTNANSTALSQNLYLDIINKTWNVKLSDYLKPTACGFQKSKDSTSSIDKYGYFMTLGALMTKLKELTIPKILNENNIPIDLIQFDYPAGEDEAICAAYPYQISLDPRICIIKPDLAYSNMDQKSSWDYFKPFHETICGENGKEITYGKIYNIYLNYDFISKKLESSTENVGDDKNVLTLYKFLQSICDGINSSLGGINNLEVAVKNDNVVTILEQNPIPGIEDIPGFEDRFKEYPSFEIFGFNPENSNSNFVKSFDFDTKITPELASLVTIGATANGGTTKNYDATAFSSWNTGLYDRFNKSFIDPADKIAADLKQSKENLKEADALGLTGIEDVLTKQQALILYKAFINAKYDDTWLGNLKNYLILSQQTPIFHSKLTYYKSSKSLGVTLKGVRTIGRNKVNPNTVENVVWAKYVKETLEYLRAQKLDPNKVLDKDEMLNKYASNYAFYLTRIFGGRFVGKDYITEELETKIEQATYWNFNSQVINEGKAAFKAYINSLHNLLLEKSKGKQGSNTLGFLPISMALTFEGLSGIKIYNQINIGQRFLPSNYPTSFKFVISTVNHEISEDGWETSIDTISTPRTFASEGFNFADLKLEAHNAQKTWVAKGISNLEGRSAIEIIKVFEGIELSPYLDSVNVPTIGYGNTFYEDGTKVKISDPSITMKRAEELLSYIVKDFEKGVKKLVKVDINENQLSALVSFAYNVGLGGFGESTLLKVINKNPNDRNIEIQFNKWRVADGIVLQALVNRRAAEAKLYFS